MPLYVAFLVIMSVIGAFAGRIARLDVPARSALLFAGETRNSLVVLPPALALPEAVGTNVDKFGPIVCLTYDRNGSSLCH